MSNPEIEVLPTIRNGEYLIDIPEAGIRIWWEHESWWYAWGLNRRQLAPQDFTEAKNEAIQCVYDRIQNVAEYLRPYATHSLPAGDTLHTLNPVCARNILSKVGVELSWADAPEDMKDAIYAGVAALVGIENDPEKLLTLEALLEEVGNRR